METLSTKLLQNLVKRNRTDAMRQLARILLEERTTDKITTRSSAKRLLLCSARMGDRKAGWLLCKYSLEGSHGFDKDMNMARYWRGRTEKRLFSDAGLMFDDKAMENESRLIYAKWLKWLDNNWIFNSAKE